MALLLYALDSKQSSTLCVPDKYSTEYGHGLCMCAHGLCTCAHGLCMCAHVLASCWELLLGSTVTFRFTPQVLWDAGLLS